MELLVSVSAAGELPADDGLPQVAATPEIVATMVFAPDGRHVGKQIIWDRETRTFSKPPKNKIPGKNITPTYYRFSEFVPALPDCVTLLGARLFIRQQLLNLRHGALVLRGR